MKYFSTLPNKMNPTQRQLATKALPVIIAANQTLQAFVTTAYPVTITIFVHSASNGTQQTKNPYLPMT